MHIVNLTDHFLYAVNGAARRNTEPTMGLLYDANSERIGGFIELDPDPQRMRISLYYPTCFYVDHPSSIPDFLRVYKQQEHVDVVQVTHVHDLFSGAPYRMTEWFFVQFVEETHRFTSWCSIVVPDVNCCTYRRYDALKRYAVEQSPYRLYRSYYDLAYDNRVNLQNPHYIDFVYDDDNDLVGFSVHTEKTIAILLELPYFVTVRNVDAIAEFLRSHSGNQTLWYTSLHEAFNECTVSFAWVIVLYEDRPDLLTVVFIGARENTAVTLSWSDVLPPNEFWPDR